MKKKIIICIILIILISLIFFITRKKIEMGSEETISSLPISYVEDIKESDNSSTEKKKFIEEQGFKANENIYEIDHEYDGREVVVIKPNIKFNIALAGAIKQQKPEFTETTEILKQAPNHSGIWVVESSRDKFLENLKKITNTSYEFDENGFLIQKDSWMKNECDNSISKMLNDNKLHVFDIKSVTYVVDDVTGEIQEYPFEEMDPYTDYEYFEDGSKEMFVVNEGIDGKVKTENCLKNIFEKAS